ncbi:MAG: hypothetical protein V3U27_00465, partial [Candidatus Tectomicrobia bacterium]
DAGGGDNTRKHRSGVASRLYLAGDVFRAVAVVETDPYRQPGIQVDHKSMEAERGGPMGRSLRATLSPSLGGQSVHCGEIGSRARQRKGD